MVESRCGILCSQCQYYNQVCKGCNQITKPFWGEVCPIKDCCQGKALDHCGLCGDFPCGLLKQFAYDPNQGDEGKRLEQCKAWLKEN